MSPTVLVADDSQTIRKVVEMALKAAPFDVVGVGSGRETMEAAERSPSVILLDYHMPDANGFEVCRALKSNGDTAQIPIIMLGGNHRDFSEDDARGAGADDVVMKPFKTDTLLEAIDALADGSALSEQPSAPASVPESTSTPPPSSPQSPQSAPAQSPQKQSAQKQSADKRQPSQPVGEMRGEMRGSQRDAQRGSGARRPSPGQNAGSQPRIPDAGGQPKGGSQPRIAAPDVNASSRAQEVSSSPSPSAPGGTTSDSGVSNIGMSRAEIETMIKEEVTRSVKAQVPSLLRNIMGDVFQKKVLPKLLDHGQQRVDAIVQDRLGEQIREAVRVEIERLLAED
jgi:DNA-binding response OmpR family regulator